jgi:hypothetical protein
VRSTVLHDAGYGTRFCTAPATVRSRGARRRQHGRLRDADDAVAAGHWLHDRTGVYFPDFGIRSEINMIVEPRDASVTGPLQTEILALV